MRDLFGYLKRKLNNDRSLGKCVVSLVLAIAMLLPLFPSAVFAESYETEAVTESGASFGTGPETAEPSQVEWTVDIDGYSYAVVSGVLPADGRATVEPTSVPRGSETAFSAYVLTVYDGRGEKYVSDEQLTVTLHNNKIAEILTEGNSVGVLGTNRYGYFVSMKKLSSEGDSVTFLSDCSSTFYLCENRIVKTITASDGNTYRITVSYDGKAHLPEDAEIRAEEVSLDGDEYLNYLQSTASTLGVDISSLTYSKLFDISIVDGAGNEYQPDENVKVTVELMESEAGSVEDLRVVHFGEEDAPVELEASTTGKSVTFETNGFSVFSFNDTSLADVILNAVFGERRLYENDDVTLTGRMPLFGTAEVNPVQVQVDGVDALVAYDIKIYANSIMKLLGIPWQPSEGAVRVTVKSDVFADAEGPLFIYHIQDEYSEPDFVASVNAVDSSVTFEAGGFSAYAIVPGIGGLEGEWITNSNELKSLIGQDDDPKGFYLAYKYPGNITYFRSSLNGNSAFNETINNGQAAVWYFESAGADNQYRIYTVIGGENRYMRNTSGNNMGLTPNAGSAAVFELSDADPYKFYFKLLGEDKWLQHSGSGNGIRLYTDKNNAANSQLSICYLPSLQDGDPYGLDGKTYGLMSWQGGTAGKALMAEQSAGAGNLDAKELTVMVKRENGTEDRLFVPNDADISMWTFNWTGDGYTLSTESNGSTVYLSVTSSGLALSGDPNAAGCKLQISPGAGINEGRICLRAGNDTVTYFDIDTGFGVNGAAGSEWLYMVELSELTADYVKTYSARKVGVSDSEIENGTPLIVYARAWDDTEKKYKFYAIGHDGSLFPVFDELDTIEWVGSQLNNFQWNFVEYYWEGTNDPNGYFELYNPYGEVYIAPQVTGGQILSADTIGVNMPGRSEGYYQTKIVAWDDANYAYAGLKVDQESGRIVSCPLEEADDFYFAILQDLPVDDVLSTVPTVDHTEYGITMTITNFNATGNTVDKNPMSAFLGNGNGGATTNTIPNLLSTDLKENGYPDAAGGSLLSLLQSVGNTREINHLFIQSTYNGEGYFEFNSAENFAHLESDGNFTVYRQLGSSDIKNSTTMKHGQFFPFNQIHPGSFTSVNKENLYSATGEVLPDSNPRKYEQLYQVSKPDYYFAVTLEASFTQTPNGKDAWGHDIIYEFTGDDDFWLYVDGELVIDLGGIHSAVPGSVNFATGDVYVNGAHTTLYDLFSANYSGRGHDQAETQAYLDRIFENKDGNWVFKDNTSHTMKIFYMERGAGASNLHMRFNLASIKPGTVELSKTLSQENSDEDLTGSVFAEYLYQVYYRGGSVGAVDLSAALSGATGSVTWSSANAEIASVNNSGQVTALQAGSVTVIAEHDGISEEFLVEIKQINGVFYVNVYKDGEILPQYLEPTEHLLGAVDGEADLVKYKNSKTSVTYHDTFTIPRTDITYYNVFLLKPGEVAVINLPETASVYRIVECGVNRNVYSKVSVNGSELTGTSVTGQDNNDPPGTVTRWDYSTDYTTSEKVPRVLYDNEVRELRDLTITKRLFDVNGNDISASGEDAEFSFRVYLATEYDNDVTATPANMQEYYVKDNYGNYCIWDADGQIFVSLGKSDYSLLTDSEKSAATFHTSMNGSISKIRAGYSVEFRNLLPGTQYRVEERPWEIPDGYSFKEYQKDATAVLAYRSGVPGVVDFMFPDVDATVKVDNYKGFGLRVNKTWTDAVFMRSREPVYFAVFTVSGDTLTMVPDSARRLNYGDTQTVYWYYDRLPVQTDFDNYVVREISVQDPSVDPDTGIVTFAGYTVFENSDPITLLGQETDDLADSPYQYTVLYDEAITTGNSNVRVFPVTNDRPSITLRKTDWNGNALPGAEFTLIDSANNFVGEFTSDSDGLITLVFLGSNKTYYLVETASPQGYCAMEGAMSISIAGNNVTVSGVSTDCYTLDQNAEPPVLTIKNRPYVFDVVKVGKQADGSSVPQAGVHFELHKKKTVGGATNYDVIPEPGFEDLVTGADGVVPGLDYTLAPGDYELREKAPLTGYYGLASHIYFTVSETGVITLGSHPAEASMSVEINASTGAKEYTVTVINRLIPPAPTGFVTHVIPFLIIGVLEILLFAIIRTGRKRKRGGGSA